MRRIRQRLTTEVRSLRGANAIMVIRRLNPIIRGWAAYYRSVVSKEVFSAVDHYLWERLYRWALRAHPNKSKRWVVARYFGTFNPSRQDRWVFGDRDSGAYLRRVRLDEDRPPHGWSWAPRRQTIRPSTEYWAERRRKAMSLMGGATASLLLRQQGRCPACGTSYCTPTRDRNPPTNGNSGPGPWRRPHASSPRRGDAAQGDDPTTRLMHAHCRERETQRVQHQPEQDALGACLSRMR